VRGGVFGHCGRIERGREGTKKVEGQPRPIADMLTGGKTSLELYKRDERMGWKTSTKGGATLPVSTTRPGSSPSVFERAGPAQTVAWAGELMVERIKYQGFSKDPEGDRSTEGKRNPGSRPMGLD